MPTHAQHLLDQPQDACAQDAILADSVHDELSSLKSGINGYGNRYVTADGYLDDQYASRLSKVVDELDSLVDPQLRRSVDYLCDLQREIE